MHQCDSPPVHSFHFSRPRQWWVAEYLDINIGSIYARRINGCLESQCIFSHYLKRQNALQALLLVFSVTPFKIDQNKNQNRSIDKVQKLGNERRYIFKDPHQDSGQRNISYTRYPKKCFTQIYRDLYGDAMLVLTWMSSNMADGNQQKHLLPSFATKA